MLNRISAASKFFSFQIQRRDFAQLAAPRTPTFFKRFYKDVSVREGRDTLGAYYEVLLDGKTVKTPARNVLRTRIEPMAYAVASEWEAQQDHVRPVCMPLMALLSTNLDLVNEQVLETCNGSLEFLGMDSVLFRTPQEPKLLARQNAAYDPLCAWFSEAYGPVTPTTSLAPPVVSDAAWDAVHAELNAMPTAELTALSVACSNTKSFITALALVKGRILPEEALKVTLLEEEYQRDQWGMAEGDHDVDLLACGTQLHAARLYSDLSKLL